MGKKVFVCGYSQESNAFNPVITQLQTFYDFGVTVGDPSGEKVCSPTAEGIIEYLTQAGAEICYGTIMRAGSGGPVSKESVDFFLNSSLKLLRECGQVDGVCVAMHGATMSDDTDDVCGYILETIRKEVGEEIPVSACFDLHANITEKIAKNTDYICGYHAYPHLDQVETGARAAKCLMEALEGRGGKLARAAIPSIASAHGYTTTKGSLNKLVNKAKALIENGTILDYTIFQVQPWLDLENFASTVIVIAKDEETAKNTAKELAYDNFIIREELLGEELLSIPSVIDKALANKSGKPVILVDSADSPNAGATADSAAVIEYLLPYRDRLVCAVAVSDIPAVEKAIALGVGKVADFTLGATKAPQLSSPVLVKDAEVVSIHDGIFTMYGPQDKGKTRDIGKTVVLKAGKIWIHVSSNGKAEGDLNFYRSFGIEPAECDLVCVKACTSFRAGYEGISAEICNTNTPGAAGVALTELPYKKRPVPTYPFEEITEQDIKAPICYRI